MKFIKSFLLLSISYCLASCSMPYNSGQFSQYKIPESTMFDGLEYQKKVKQRQIENNNKIQADLKRQAQARQQMEMQSQQRRNRL
jgi:hypothetical protein